MKVDVIIPAYRPDKGFSELLKKLMVQTYQISRIIIINTEKKFWNSELEKEFPDIEVFHIKKEEFDHGGTRRKGAALSSADVMLFMTQDAVPADEYLVENLVKAMQAEDVGAAYARQLPKEDCRFIEKYTRSFNYPSESVVKYEKDTVKFGVKTYFCSNVCAAYKKDIYEKLGGFVEKAIFNEDMIYAGNMVKAGYGIAYAANARVIHSHNYSAIQQLHRNFDLGVSQAEHKEIFEGVPSEGEGLRLVKKSFVYLIKKGKFWLIPQLVIQSGFKYVGYRLGKSYKKLPKQLVMCLTMNPGYWKKNLT